MGTMTKIATLNLEKELIDRVDELQQNQSNLAIAVANLLNRIETLERQLDKQEEYQQEQNEFFSI